MFSKTWQKWKDMSYLGNLSAQYKNKNAYFFPPKNQKDFQEGENGAPECTQYLRLCLNLYFVHSHCFLM